jgi:hypothetical protein
MREVSCEFPLALKGGFDFYMKEGAGKANRNGGIGNADGPDEAMIAVCSIQSFPQVFY